MSAVAELERGRDAYAREAWGDAFASLTATDESEPLGADDLELLATAAYMIGREDEYLDVLERAYRVRLEAGGELAALRCAFWVGVTLARRGEMGRAGGWLGRAQRLLEAQDGESAEHGYMLIPAVFEHEAAGEWQAAETTAAEAAGIGERFGDSNLFALAAHERGHILIQNGRTKKGLGLLDEAMLAVTAGELSPIVSGIVYCGVILACQEANEVRRAREWTAALSSWCERQPDLVAFTGRCRVHRAEILQLQGSMREALEEAIRAGERCLEAMNEAAAGEASYRRGEIHRVLGELDAAEEAYREASRYGREPQPGLALLRLAQGRSDAAEAAIRRFMAETTTAGRRAAVLPAGVEIMLAAGDLEAARAACSELELIAGEDTPGAITAIAMQARGSLALAEGDAGAALGASRSATRTWQELDAPYEAARARVLVALACRRLGDEDAAELEFEAARATFADLAAEPDVARVDELAGAASGAGSHDLTERELEVLRHLAAGATNKTIASELVLSVRTVDRHVSNIFVKFGVSSRAAATAYAYEHQLL